MTAMPDMVVVPLISVTRLGVRPTTDAVAAIRRPSGRLM